MGNPGGVVAMSFHPIHLSLLIAFKGQGFSKFSIVPYPSKGISLDMFKKRKIPAGIVRRQIQQGDFSLPWTHIDFATPGLFTIESCVILQICRGGDTVRLRGLVFLEQLVYP